MPVSALRATPKSTMGALALALLLAAPAAANEADLALLPSDATVAAHVKISALLKTPLVSALLTQAKANPAVQKRLAEMKSTYGLDVEKELEALTLMVDGSKQGRPLIVLHTSADYAKLLAGAKKMDPGAKETTHAGTKVLVGDDDLSMAKKGARVLLGDLALVKAALTDKSGPGNAELAKRFGEVSGKGQAWFAAELPEQARQQMAIQEPELKGVRSVRGSADLSNGVKIRLAVAGEKGFAPEKVAKKIDAQLAKAKVEQSRSPMAAGMGLVELIDGVKAQAKDGELRLSVDLSQAQVAKLQMMAQMMMGMASMKAGATPGVPPAAAPQKATPKAPAQPVKP